MWPQAPRTSMSVGLAMRVASPYHTCFAGRSKSQASRGTKVATASLRASPGQAACARDPARRTHLHLRVAHRLGPSGSAATADCSVWPAGALAYFHVERLQHLPDGVDGMMKHGQLHMHSAT